MLTAYIKAAMRRAKYKIIDDPDRYFGEIDELSGVWANGPTLEDCRDELEEVVEEWIFLGLKFGDLIPVLDDIDLNIKLEPIDVETYQPA